MYRQLVVFAVLLGTGSLLADEPERPVVKSVGLELKADPEVVKILDNLKAPALVTTATSILRAGSSYSIKTSARKFGSIVQTPGN